MRLLFGIVEKKMQTHLVASAALFLALCAPVQAQQNLKPIRIGVLEANSAAVGAPRLEAFTNMAKRVG